MARKSIDRGKVALVTGASSGIGQAAAVELARRGYQVAIHYHNNEAGARETLEKIRALENGRARVYSFDVSNPGEINQIAGELLEDFGRIDALVNNAGAAIKRIALAEMSFDFWRHIMAINLDGAFLVTRAFLPRMIQAGSGCIVNVASLSARNGGSEGVGAYAAAKGGLLTLTKAMAKEFVKFGIRVNCINPGVIDTSFHHDVNSKEMMDRFLAAIPLKRCGTSEEIAKVIAFLLSEDAAFMTGECVEVNGGMLMD